MSEGSTKVALVTGAAGGIGTATVQLFLQNEWSVIAIDQIASSHKASMSIQADIAKPDEIERVGREVRTRYSRLDAIVNNAAEQLTKPLVETKVEEWDRVMASNVRAIYLLVAQFHRELGAAKGAIVNVASIHALVTSSGMAAYVASKGAVVSLTRAMALELAPEGVRVNAVLPGAIDTPMLAAGLKRAQLSGAKAGVSPVDELAARHPLGRIGQPDDVAEAIYFLADVRRSSFITGQTLVVDGGAAARLSTE